MRFIEVRLPAKDIDAQAVFYSNVLNLPMIQRSAGEVHFQVGSSRLVFVNVASHEFAPQHFAFNIPEHRFDDAKAWLQARCDLIPDEAGHDEFFFEGWNAHAVYFYDPDGNIGELIARHTQPTPHAGAFDASALQCISEVSVVTDDPSATARLACERLSASVYRTEISDSFAPVGDEDGLLIIVKTGRLWFSDHKLPARPAPITIAIAGAPSFALTSSVNVTNA